MTASYVKFIKGTTKAWENLPVENRDGDCLYFISDKDSTVGTLYLGNKRVGGGVSSLADVADIVADNVQDGQVLTYDSAANDGKGGWVPTEIQNAPVFDGTENGLLPAFNNSEAQDGITYVLNQSGVWVPLDIDHEEILKSISDLETKLAELVKTIDGNEETETPGLIEKVQEALDKIDESDIGNLNQRVGSLEDLLYSTSESEGGEKVERYIDKTVYHTTVGDLSQLLDYDKDDPTNLVDEINKINNRLKWGELPE